MKKPSDKTLQTIFDYTKMAVFVLAFVAVFIGGALYQVFEYYPQTNYSYNPQSPIIKIDELSGEMKISHELAEDGKLKWKYINMVRYCGAAFCILALLLVFIQYLQEPKNHFLNKIIPKLEKWAKEGNEED